MRAPIRFLRICFVHPSDTLVYVTRTNQISYSMFRTPIRFHRVRYSNQSDLLHCVVHINHLNILLSPTRYYQQGLFARPIHNAVFRFVAFCSSNKELPTWPTLKGQFFYLYQMRSSGACFASERQRYHSISESVVLIFHAQQIVYFAYWLLAWQRLKRAAIKDPFPCL